MGGEEIKNNRRKWGGGRSRWRPAREEGGPMAGREGESSARANVCLSSSLLPRAPAQCRRLLSPSVHGPSGRLNSHHLAPTTAL